MAVRDLPEYQSKHPEYIYISDTKKWLKDYMKNKPKRIAVDTETHYNPELKGSVIRFVKGNPNNEPFCVSLYDGNNGYYVEDVMSLRPLLEDPEIEKIFHNSKYDLHMFRNMELEVKGKIWDTMIMIHLIDEEFMCKMPSGAKKKSKKLKDLAYHFLNGDSHELEDLVGEYRDIIARNTGRKKDDVSYLEVSEKNHDLMKDYACADTDFTFKLFEIFYQDLINQQLLLAYDTDMNATLEILEVERVGVKINKKYYNHLDKRLGQIVDILKYRIRNLVGYDFNINSAEELVKAFQDIWEEEMEWAWYTEKEEYRTDDKVMKHIRDNENFPMNKLAELVLKYRDTTKVKDTFVGNMLYFCQSDGRVHPNFNVCPNDFSNGGTVTGRLSSTDPNFQNIPKDDKRVRKGIIPENDYILIEFDYDQQEYRMLAHYAKDENFMKIIHDGKDIHAGTAELMLQLTLEEAMVKKNRDKGKRLNFGIVYGLGLAALANNLGYKIDEPLYKKAGWLIREKGIKPWEMPTLEQYLDKYGWMHNEEELKAIKYYFSDEAKSAIAQAQEMKNTYFAQFPQIQSFIKDCINVTKKRGWIRTWVGRRRHFHDARNEAYKAPNALIQGGCGDILKTKLREIGEYLRSINAKSRIVNTVHDSILFEIHKSEIDIIPDIKRILETLPFRVPITCGLEFSTKSWANLKAVTFGELKEKVA